MNVTSYLPDELVPLIDRLARQRQVSRSAVIREALEAYLRREQPGSWPEPVMAWPGDSLFPAFESLREAEEDRIDDPFVEPDAR